MESPIEKKDSLINNNYQNKVYPKLGKKWWKNKKWNFDLLNFEQE